MQEGHSHLTWKQETSINICKMNTGLIRDNLKQKRVNSKPGGGFQVTGENQLPVWVPTRHLKLCHETESKEEEKTSECLCAPSSSDGSDEHLC
ncbi:hypothetical protein CK820_G0037093 [Pan troglodytes]|uniref:Uncharacterized protein n=1 Tax=Pan troglodytes TaxID=9598 RepID=A0A2J8KNN9_PANTR|nr:hypothetical protein CK820_G0037093 [Pan troglodytes]